MSSAVLGPDHYCIECGRPVILFDGEEKECCGYLYIKCPEPARR